jgi:hypothetical protein
MGSHFGLQEEFRYVFFGPAPLPSSEGITQSPSATRIPIFPYVCPLHIDGAGKALKGSYRRRPSRSKLPYIPDKCRPAVTAFGSSSLVSRFTGPSRQLKRLRSGGIVSPGLLPGVGMLRALPATYLSRIDQEWSRTYNTKFPVRELERKTTAKLKKRPWR